MKPPTSSPKSDAFHAHLDECDRCRDRPFDLCVIGERKFEAAADEALERGARECNAAREFDHKTIRRHGR